MTKSHSLSLSNTSLYLKSIYEARALVLINFLEKCDISFCLSHGEQHVGLLQPPRMTWPIPPSSHPPRTPPPAVRPSSFLISDHSTQLCTESAGCKGHCVQSKMLHPSKHHTARDVLACTVLYIRGRDIDRGWIWNWSVEEKTSCKESERKRR